MNTSQSSPRRDSSPVRKSKPVEQTSPLTAQIVAWLGADFEAPIVDDWTGACGIRWTAWEREIQAFVKQHCAPAPNDAFPYSAVVAFFIAAAHRRHYGSYELQLLLQRVCCLGVDYAVAEQFRAELWPLAEKLNLTHLYFWNTLSHHLTHSVAFAEHQRDGKFRLRYSNPIKDPEFVSPALEPLYALAFPPPPVSAQFADRLDAHACYKSHTFVSSEVPDKAAAVAETKARAAATAASCLEEINKAIWPLLPTLIEGGRFGLPTLNGANPLAPQLAAALAAGPRPTVSLDTQALTLQ